MQTVGNIVWIVFGGLGVAGGTAVLDTPLLSEEGALTEESAGLLSNC